MADNTAAIEELFNQQVQTGQQLITDARADIENTFAALGNSSIYDYTPYEWQVPSPPIIGPLPSLTGPSPPGAPSDPKEPTLKEFGSIPNPVYGTQPINSLHPPTITFPGQPQGEPTDSTGQAPGVSIPVFPTAPPLIAVPDAALPYPYITIPNAPIFTPPAFDGVKPDDIQTITLAEYLQKLADAYAQYSTQMPALIQNNTMAWFRAFIAENPNVRILDGMVTSYLNTGGTGIPLPLEEAIITRAVDRVTNESRRAQARVWETVSQRGLVLASGALMSGLKEARAVAQEATSKVAVDVAIKNLDLEHDHMKFMLTLGRELQTMLLNFANDTGKIVTEINGQAIELTKTVLTGMIEINNANVRIYTAKWEGYRAAVEVFKARWMAIESQIRVYEAQIKAELAKVEVNKATVELINAIVNANHAIVLLYKTQIDAETAKLEADRVRVMAYTASVQGYVAKIEAYKARWEGYSAAVNGQLAIANVYKAQVEGFTADVNAYKAGVEAYVAQVQGATASINAIATQNEENLKAWSTELDGKLRGYVARTQGYSEQWKAIGEQARAGANITGIQSEFLSKMYTSQVQVDIERAREHMAQWRQQLEASLQASQAMVQTSQVAGQLASSTMNGLTAFAGTLATSSS
jgi:hypothetical protein